MSSTTSTPISTRLASVKNIIVVLAGKGGVGKSSVTTQLALSLSLSGARVGVLDIDLTGPSIPRMMGLDGEAVRQSRDGWVPVYTHPNSTSTNEETVETPGRMAVMSVGFLLKNKGDSVVWRGPKKNAMIRQFLSDVRWGELDFLVIDTPPGTSDEHLSLMEHLAPLHSRLSSVIVTTPQAVALADAMKCLSFTRNVNLPVLGLIENMSGYVCPCCGEISNVFSTGGGEAMAKREELRFLGALPVDTELVELLDNEALKAEGKLESGGSEASPPKSMVERYKQTPSFSLFQGITDKILERFPDYARAISPPNPDTGN